MIFHIFGSLGEFERDLIRERTNAGLKAARARGRVGGRKNKLTPSQTKTLLQCMRVSSIPLRKSEKLSKLANQLCIDISGRPINVKSAPQRSQNQRCIGEISTSEIIVKLKPSTWKPMVAEYLT
jgi:DNA invertase Pin-like site-specific DNA recombinase